jgi:hypothetical protein
MTRQHTNHTEQRIFEALSERTGTATEIARRIPACPKNVKAILNRLHLCALVHVSGWRRGNSGPVAAIYGFGPGVDAPRLEPLPGPLVSKRYRTRLREKLGEHYGLVHKMQKKRQPGTRLVVNGQVVYQQ